MFYNSVFKLSIAISVYGNNAIALVTGIWNGCWLRAGALSPLNHVAGPANLQLAKLQGAGWNPWQWGKVLLQVYLFIYTEISIVYEKIKKWHVYYF